MDNEELAFNAWILIGNVLQTLLRGAGANAAIDLDQAELAHLDGALQPIQPPQMLETLRNLTESQRNLLRKACKQAFAMAGTRPNPSSASPNPTHNPSCNSWPISIKRRFPREFAPNPPHFA